jgi:hypothetical protein
MRKYLGEDKSEHCFLFYIKFLYKMDSQTLIALISSLLIISIILSVGVYFYTKEEEVVGVEKKAFTNPYEEVLDYEEILITKAPTTTVAPTTKPPVPAPTVVATGAPVARDCPDLNNGMGVGKPGITKVERDCGLGPNYTGKRIYMCDAQGQWLIDNKCVSSGNADKVDITGKWRYNISGNDWGTIDVAFNMNTGIGIMSGGNIPADINPGQTTITYKEGLGYQVYYPYNQFAKFKDSTYRKLDGGNFYFEKA